MFHFVEACHKDFPKLKYGYMLKISNLFELLNYIQIKQIPTLGKAFDNAFDSLEKNYHTSNEISDAVIKMATISDKSIVEVIGKLSQDMYVGQVKCLEKEPIAFQKNGSWMPFSGVTVLSEKFSEEFIWPVKKILTMKDDVKITRWPGGNHFYISVNEISLVKCNTLFEAEEAAKNYIDKHNEAK